MSGHKYVKLIICSILAILAFSLIGCNSKKKITIKAVYLVPENGGQLTKADIDKYPQVIRVTSFRELKRLTSKNTAVWIDKDSVKSVDLNWVVEKAQSKIPIVLIGYNNEIYSFREKLPCFGIKGPYIDWSKYKLEPGYSIWMYKDKANTSAFAKGYDSVPDTKQILSITNMLLEGKSPK